ncbi:hypothetical protein LMF32_04645 [Desemzia sp. C1]|uniref:hypothetical protein n=1 Tax=Desemzia sp. C1 TaxID=2892016 RepID=UPI001E523ACA|nr:hypothetical protein [Desemzia sp. C1]MCI3028392.1 hypothetical protein [Desemzia sp. C1]
MFTLGRKIDLRYKPNLIIVLASLIVVAAGWLIFGEFPLGISLGGGFFLTWVFSRELDPAYDYSAYLAAVLSLSMLIDFEAIHFLNALWLVLHMRAVNGITGKDLTLFDVLTLMGLTVFLSFNYQNSIYLFLFALAMMFIRQTRTKPKAAGIAGILAFILFIVQSTWMSGLSFNPVNFLNLFDLLMIAGPCFSLIVFRSLSRIKMEDDKGNSVAQSRIFSSQLLYNMAVLLLFFFSDISFSDQMIYLSANIGVVLHFLILKSKIK